jgi:uncharacterized protein YecE (DUF72 family)
VYLRHLDDPAVDEVWSRFLSALGPLRKAGKLGAVLFQFPPWFTIKRANKEYLAECAERARSLQVCVEFRSPTWLSGTNCDETMELLAKHNLAYVCVGPPEGISTVGRGGDVLGAGRRPLPWPGPGACRRVRRCSAGGRLSVHEAGP